MVFASEVLLDFACRSVWMTARFGSCWSIQLGSKSIWALTHSPCSSSSRPDITVLLKSKGTRPLGTLGKSHHIFSCRCALLPNESWLRRSGQLPPMGYRLACLMSQDLKPHPSDDWLQIQVASIICEITLQNPKNSGDHSANSKWQDLER